MIIAVTIVAEQSIEPVSPRTSARRRWRWLTAAAAAIVLLGGLEAFWYWRTNLHEFSYFGATMSAPGRVGDTTYVDTALQSGQLDLRTAHPRIVQNSAGATVHLIVCPGGAIGAESAPGGAGAPIGSACHPWRVGAIHPGLGHDQIIFAITPRRAGTVRIAGVDVTYARGIRTGSQRAGGEVTVRVR